MNNQLADCRQGAVERALANVGQIGLDHPSVPRHATPRGFRSLRDFTRPYTMSALTKLRTAASPMRPRARCCRRRRSHPRGGGGGYHGVLAVLPVDGAANVSERFARRMFGIDVSHACIVNTSNIGVSASVTGRMVAILAFH